MLITPRASAAQADNCIYGCIGNERPRISVYILSSPKTKVKCMKYPCPFVHGRIRSMLGNFSLNSILVT
jgi:hypothetical protein